MSDKKENNYIENEAEVGLIHGLSLFNKLSEVGVPLTSSERQNLRYQHSKAVADLYEAVEKDNKK